MNADLLRDRFHWGLNRAANVLGSPTEAYRPSGVSNPLDRANRYLRLHAAFSRADGNFDQPVGYGTATWRGYFDASYTRAGDYLVQGRDIWFIAAQDSILPLLCVKTNQIISVSRSVTPVTAPSAGPIMAQIITHWPASVLGTDSSSKPAAQLPGDTTTANWTVLMPLVRGQVLQSADIVSMADGVTGVIAAAEKSNLGWRLRVRQVTT